MSCIDIWLCEVSKERAFEHSFANWAAINSPEGMEARRALEEASGTPFACERVEENTDGLRSRLLCEALQSSHHYRCAFNDVAWFFAEAMRRLSDSETAPGEFAELHESLARGLESWVFDRSVDLAADTPQIIRCLQELQMQFVRRWRAVSRVLIGTLILLSRSGILLRDLKSLGERVRYGYEDTLEACESVKQMKGQIDLTQHQGMVEMGNGPEPHLGWAFAEPIPVVALCTPLAYNSFFFGRVAWFTYDSSECPMENFLILRSTREVLERLSQEDCGRILEELETGKGPGRPG